MTHEPRYASRYTKIVAEGLKIWLRIDSQSTLERLRTPSIKPYLPFLISDIRVIGWLQRAFHRENNHSSTPTRHELAGDLTLKEGSAKRNPIKY